MTVEWDVLNMEVCKMLFGDNVDWTQLSNWKVNRENNNLWVWKQMSNKASLVCSIYSWLNSDHSVEDEVQEGWSQIWKLCTIPRVKVFI